MGMTKKDEEVVKSEDSCKQNDILLFLSSYLSVYISYVHPKRKKA